MGTVTLLDPLEEQTASTLLQPWTAAIRAARRCGHAPAAAPDLLVALAARLGIELTFDDLGYESRFRIVATDQVDATATAQRRWFYLADDLGLPTWPVSHVSVSSIGA